MIRRSFDASEINPILNDHFVFRSIKLPGMKPGDIDVTSIIENPANVLLMADGGGIIFAQIEPGIYEVHTAFFKPKNLADGSGPHIRNACLAAYRWMFMHTDCMTLHTKAPEFNRAAIVFAPVVGWKFDFQRKEVWPTDNGMADMSYFTIRYDDWVRVAPDLVERGQSFHKKLDDEFLRLGVAFENHSDDETHDRYVGACAEMLRGQPEKAVVLYNRWARVAGYAPIALLSSRPVIIDIQTAVLLIEDRTFTVIKCQPQH